MPRTFARDLDRARAARIRAEITWPLGPGSVDEMQTRWTTWQSRCCRTLARSCALDAILADDEARAWLVKAEAIERRLRSREDAAAVAEYRRWLASIQTARDPDDEPDWQRVPDLEPDDMAIPF